MLKLIHHPLSAPSRKIRLQLAEKEIEFELELEKPWDRREAFLLLNPAAEVPVLIAEDGTPIADATAISELLEEVHPEPPLLGATPLERAEVRRLVGWFDGKFWREVGRNLVEEKIFRRLYGQGGPDSLALRAGRANIHAHLDYIGWLSLRRNWLAGERFSLADITAAAHLSIVDYVGDVPWSEHEDAKLWYARVKSRPSFRPLLSDLLPGAPPPRHYADLDF
jgi:glutathione S-transferase